MARRNRNGSDAGRNRRYRDRERTDAAREKLAAIRAAKSPKRGTAAIGTGTLTVIAASVITILAQCARH